MNLHHDKEAFSEDIDLSYTAESGMPGESRKKQLKNNIVSTVYFNLCRMLIY